jgi:hypothetical protein
VALEALVRELPTGTWRNELFAQLEQLRGLIKTLKPE